jgi:dolichol-phosphate mannosyltransferase
MDVVVLLPTYNERQNLAHIAQAVLAHDGFRVLVIDDGSPDGTGELADGLSRASSGRVAVLHRTSDKGFGRAYVAGMRHALAQSPDFICQMDADGSHDPADLPRLVACARECDLAIGSRYVEGGALVNWPWYRLALSSAANAYVRRVLRLEIADCTAGYRCWQPSMLARIGIDTLRSNGYAFQVETLYRTIQAGGRVREVPIVFTERELGRSKMSGSVMLEAAGLPWRLRASRQPAAQPLSYPAGRESQTGAPTARSVRSGVE